MNIEHLGLGQHLGKSKLAFQQGVNPFAIHGFQVQGHVQHTDLNPGISGPSQFQQVLSHTYSQVNQVVRKPDALLKDAMSGGPVDLHTVMIANTQAELAINLASQSMTKIVQAYDRITQIQI